MVGEASVIFRKVVSLARGIARRGRGPGYVDNLDHNSAAGWLAPLPGETGSARISVHIDGHHEMNIVADLERRDVLEQGLAPLNCGFDFPLPARLKDGQRHVVELRVGKSGPILNGGKLLIEAGSLADSIEGGAIPAPEPEGGVFLDRTNLELRGWAKGSATVEIQIDGGASTEVDLVYDVPGLGGDFGFKFPIPDEFLDGAWHQAEVRHPSGAPLDGSPLGFCLTPDRPVVTVEAINGSRVELSVKYRDGQVPSPSVHILADGQMLESSIQNGRIVASLPTGIRHLVLLSSAEAGGVENEVLARYVIDRDQAVDWSLPGVAANSLTAEDQPLMVRATRAFAEFCKNPDERFDAQWYASTYPEVSCSSDAIVHYQTIGAKAGFSPGPRFDEAVALSLYPELAPLISKEELPCLFALELVLGDGTLGTLTGLQPDLQSVSFDEIAGTPPLAGPSVRSPETAEKMLSPIVPTRLANPAQNIYAAWLNRLDVTAEKRAEIDADEESVRREATQTQLSQAPLVSIIMPSWNRAFTIGEAIQSVLEQSYQNWELLVCDDASEDRTSEVVHAFKDPRIRYMKFLKSNGAGARNKGLRFAQGEYIAYLDSDNIWHPHFLEMMLRQLLAQPGRSLAYCAYLDTEITGARVQLHGVSRPPFRPIRLATKNFMDLNTIVHHRRLYDWMGGFDNALPRLQDWDLMLRYTSIFRPHYVNRIGVFYRRNAAWGQVTHLFQNSGAQDHVKEKSRRREAGHHDRLNIEWPDRRRVTVIAGSATGNGEPILAQSLANLAVSAADVDLIFLGGQQQEFDGETVEGVTRIVPPTTLTADLERMKYALASKLAGQPVLTVGVAANTLRRLGVDPDQCLRLWGSGEGAQLRGVGNPSLRFYLGGLPIEIPPATTQQTSPLILSFDGGSKVVAEARRQGVELLIPPHSQKDQWRHVSAGGEELVGDASSLPALLAGVSLAISLRPVSSLDPFRFSLLSALQGVGVPLAVPVDAGRAYSTSMARQWIEARAAYELQKVDPAWVFDKCRKLLNDDAKIATMQSRSKTVHALVQHHDLVSARLEDALFYLLFGNETGGTSYDRT